MTQKQKRLYLVLAAGETLAKGDEVYGEFARPTKFNERGSDSLNPKTTIVDEGWHAWQPRADVAEKVGPTMRARRPLTPLGARDDAAGWMMGYFTAALGNSALAVRRDGQYGGPEYLVNEALKTAVAASQKMSMIDLSEPGHGQ